MKEENTLIHSAKELAARLDISAESLPLKALIELASSERVASRRVRQGVTLIYACDEGFFTMLVYQEQCWGLFAHRADCDIPTFLDDLKEFRFGWLPHEVVLKQGGMGSVFAGAMPAEAEGFMPTFITGSKKDTLKGQGILIQKDIFTTDKEHGIF